MTTGRAAGREAATHFRVLRRIESDYGKFTLVEVRIETGRTHQIRVHMASLGHPVVGDALYGAPRILRSRTRKPAALARNFLHAAAIEINHPQSCAPLAFSRPVPRELEDFLALLTARPL